MKRVSLIAMLVTLGYGTTVFAGAPGTMRVDYFHSGNNTTAWKATCVDKQRPEDWTVVTRDLWQDFGPFTLTGIAPTAMGGEAKFDKIELLRSLDVEE